MWNLLTLLFLMCDLCFSYKILVIFPFPSRSHAILGDGFVRQLLKAGHEITYITPLPTNNPSARLRQVDVSSNMDIFPVDIMDLNKLMTNEVDLADYAVVLPLMYGFANATLLHHNVQQLIQNTKEEFDVVVAEWMYSELYSGFSAVFDCPLIWSSSMEPHAMVLSLIDEAPNPAYVPDNLSNINPPFTFWQRVEELWKLYKWKYQKWSYNALETETFTKAFSSAVAKRGRKLPGLGELKYNASLMFGNSHVALGHAVHLPQSYIPIGGYHISEQVQPLPQDIKNMMDNAEHGVIYFSMGTLLRSETMPADIKRGLVEVFRSLKQTVIWKFDEIPSNLPKNVHILKFAPQQSILNHPNCVLFITHGGYLSTNEAVYFGVPIIGIPMFADQFTNVLRAVNKGFAKKVTFNYDTPINLKTAIEDILGNPKYRDRVKRLSFVYHDRPVSPGAELVHWVQHVVRTRGAPHLRSPALQLSCYQKAYLDLLAVVVALTVVAILGLKLLYSFLLSTKLNIHSKID